MDQSDNNLDAFSFDVKYLSATQESFDGVFSSDNEFSIVSAEIVKSIEDLQHDTPRQLPTAQVMPNVPFTPPKHQRQQKSSKREHHRRNNEEPRKLFEQVHRQSTYGRHNISDTQRLRPPVEGTAVESHCAITDDGHYGLDETMSGTKSEHFTVPTMEETMNQSTLVPNMQLKPQTEQHSSCLSPHRARHPALPPEEGHSFPEGYNGIPYSHIPTIPVPSEIFPSSQPINQYHAATKVATYPAVGPVVYPDTNKIQDLTSWQKILNSQNEDAMRSQLGNLHIRNPHLSHTSYLPSSYSADVPGLSATTALSYIPAKVAPDRRLLVPAGYSDVALHLGPTDLGSLEGLIQAKERILQEKNLVIERQKMELNHMQDKMREKQIEDRHKLYSSSSVDGARPDLFILKLQEKDYEIYSLRDQLTQLNTSKSAETEQLTRKLGQTEYEMKEAIQKDKERQNVLKKDTHNLTVKLNEKDALVVEMKDKYKRTRDKYDRIKLKVESMERYLEDLPTADDYAKSTDDIVNLRQGESLLKGQMTDLQSELTRARNTSREKELEATTLEEANVDLQIDIKRLKVELGKMQAAFGATADEEPTTLKLCNKQEFEDMKKEREILTHEVNQLKKVADSKHKRMKKLQSNHQHEIKQLEERLRHEEDTAVGLGEEIENRERQNMKMRKTMDDLAAENQKLLSKNIQLQQGIRELELVVSSDKFKGNVQLMKDLSGCVKELQSFMQLCLQSAAGAEPNVSMLLGVRSHSVLSVEVGHGEMDDIQTELEEVQQIRNDIDGLRSYLSDRYAEDFGNNCITQ